MELIVLVMIYDTSSSACKTFCDNNGYKDDYTNCISNNSADASYDCYNVTYVNTYHCIASDANCSSDYQACNDSCYSASTDGTADGGDYYFGEYEDYNW